MLNEFLLTPSQIRQRLLSQNLWINAVTQRHKENRNEKEVLCVFETLCSNNLDSIETDSEGRFTSPKTGRVEYNNSVTFHFGF